MSIKILLTGTYSSWNKGDAAMQLSTAAVIRRHIPGAQITISSPFPHQDKHFYSNDTVVVASYRRRLIFAGFQLIRSSLWRLIYRLTGYSADWVIPEDELQSTLSADVVIDLSGDMLTDDYGPHVAWSHYLPILHALILDRPVFICAQSIGPFRWTSWIAYRLFRRVDAISIRDEISASHLEEIGISKEQFQLTADMAFLLETVPKSRTDEILEEEGISISNREILGVSLSRIVERLYNRNKANNAAPFIDLIAEVLDDFSEKYDVDILFISHVTGPTPAKDDRLIAGEVADKMSKKVHLIRGDYRPEELKSIIKECKLFLGARMHANIAALSSGVPTIALSYSHKTLGIMSTFDQSHWIIGGHEISQYLLKYTLSNAWQEHSATKRKINYYSNISYRNAELNLDILHSLLEIKKIT